MTRLERIRLRPGRIELRYLGTSITMTTAERMVAWVVKHALTDNKTRVDLLTSFRLLFLNERFLLA